MWKKYEESWKFKSLMQLDKSKFEHLRLLPPFFSNISSFETWFPCESESIYLPLIDIFFSSWSGFPEGRDVVGRGVHVGSTVAFGTTTSPGKCECCFKMCWVKNLCLNVVCWYVCGCRLSASWTLNRALSARDVQACSDTWDESAQACRRLHPVGTRALGS